MKARPMSEKPLLSPRGNRRHRRTDASGRHPCARTGRRGAVASGAQRGQVDLAQPHAGRKAGHRQPARADHPQPDRGRLDRPARRRAGGGQIVFVDTPGLHDPRSALGRFMVQEAMAALSDADAILLVVDAPGSVAGGHREPPAGGVQDRRTPGRGGPQQGRSGKGQASAPAHLAALVRTRTLRGARADLGHPGNGRRRPGGRAAGGVAGGPPDARSGQAHRSERAVPGGGARSGSSSSCACARSCPGAVAVVVDNWEERAGGDVVIDASILVEREAQKAIVVGRWGDDDPRGGHRRPGRDHAAPWAARPTSSST